MSLVTRTRRFSVAEYHRMVDAGILREDDQVELVEGEIVEMPPIGPLHAVCVDRLNERFSAALLGRAIVRVQGPITLGTISEPQPDLAVLRPPVNRYAAAHPGPEDVLLVIEVADTTLDEDRARKIPAYARAGIRETWLANLPAQVIEVYRAPASGHYRDVREVGRGERIVPEASPDLTLAVDDLLG